jgi:hypothetical protein
MKAETASSRSFPRSRMAFRSGGQDRRRHGLLFEPTPVIAWEIKRYDHRNREVGTRYSSRSNPDSLGRPPPACGPPRGSFAYFDGGTCSDAEAAVRYALER